jgi:hypothetical protein
MMDSWASFLLWFLGGILRVYASSEWPGRSSCIFFSFRCDRKGAPYELRMTVRCQGLNLSWGK